MTAGRRGISAVFLDRDGVLNRAIVRGGKPYAPTTVGEIEILPGVREACATLRQAGLRLIVVTNQPDIGRGTLERDVADEINRTVQRDLQLDDVRMCPHDDADACSCRKPAPGLLLDAARDWGVDLRASVMVGDRWKDVESGQRAGCKTVFIDHEYAERRPDAPDLTVASLTEAVSWILEMVLVHEGT